MSTKATTIYLYTGNKNKPFERKSVRESPCGNYYYWLDFKQSITMGGDEQTMTRREVPKSDEMISYLKTIDEKSIDHFFGRLTNNELKRHQSEISLAESRHNEAIKTIGHMLLVTYEMINESK